MNAITKDVRNECLFVTFEVQEGWEQWILVSSDRHWDSVKSNRALQKRHLSQAMERNALIIDLGDFFDAMQGRNDKRGSKSAIRPEHQRGDYFTALTETAAEWLTPYSKNILMLGKGNHETAITRHNEINLTWHLARLLNQNEGTNIHLGHYAGYMRFYFRQGKRTYLSTKTVYYNHGSGGNSPVTKGVIQTNRRGAYLVEPDIIFTGHTHQTWIVPITRERMSAQGRVYFDQQWHVQVPSYKEPSRLDGWEVEKGMAPVMTGAIWWRLYLLDNEIHSEFTWAT